MSIIYIPSTNLGEVYLDQKTNEVVALKGGCLPLVMGLDQGYENLLPRTASEIDMSDQEFQELALYALDTLASAMVRHHRKLQSRPKKLLPKLHSSA